LRFPLSTNTSGFPCKILLPCRFFLELSFSPTYLSIQLVPLSHFPVLCIIGFRGASPSGTERRDYFPFDATPPPNTFRSPNYACSCFCLVYIPQNFSWRVLAYCLQEHSPWIPSHVWRVNPLPSITNDSKLCLALCTSSPRPEDVESWSFKCLSPKNYVSSVLFDFHQLTRTLLLPPPTPLRTVYF